MLFVHSLAIQNLAEYSLGIPIQGVIYLHVFCLISRGLGRSTHFHALLSLLHLFSRQLFEWAWLMISPTLFAETALEHEQRFIT